MGLGQIESVIKSEIEGESLSEKVGNFHERELKRQLGW